MTTTRYLTFAATILAAATATHARAQDAEAAFYRNQTVRLVVGFGCSNICVQRLYLGVQRGYFSEQRGYLCVQRGYLCDER